MVTSRVILDLTNEKKLTSRDLLARPATISGQTIDNNPAKIGATKDIISRSGFKGTSKVIEFDLLDYEGTEKYDLVIAELVSPTQNDPLLFLNRLTDHLVLGRLLLDFRTTLAPVKPEENKLLFDLSNEIYSAVHESNWVPNSRKIIENRCRKIQKLISATSPATVFAVESFLSYWLSGDAKYLEKFRPWWGRGTQYVSVIKSI